MVKIISMKAMYGMRASAICGLVGFVMFDVLAHNPTAKLSRAQSALTLFCMQVFVGDSPNRRFAL